MQGEINAFEKDVWTDEFLKEKDTEHSKDFYVY